jgi:hypothetical protein
VPRKVSEIVEQVAAAKRGQLGVACEVGQIAAECLSIIEAGEGPVDTVAKERVALGVE